MDSNVDTLSVGEAAKFLRVSVRTMQRWDNTGRLEARRTRTDRRFYTRGELATFADAHERVHKPDRTVYLERE